VVLLALRKVASERLSRQDKLASEVLQALDLLGVALADVLEVGLQACEPGRNPGLARAAAGVGRRQPQEDRTRYRPQPALRAFRRLGTATCRFGLIVHGHRRWLDYLEMLLTAARLL
jgi:hypothetical protein